VDKEGHNTDSVPADTIFSRIVHSLHRLFMRRPLDAKSLARIQQFSHYGLGLIMAKSLSTVTQVCLGRYLGADVYGQVTVVLVLAGFLYLPMTNGWGLAMVRLVAAEKDARVKLQILKATILVAAVVSVAYLLLLWLSSDVLAAMTGVGRGAMLQTIVITATTAWWFLCKQIAQAFQAWRQYIAIENIWAITVLLLIMLLAFLTDVRDQRLVWAFVIGYLVSTYPALSRAYRSVCVATASKFVRAITLRGAMLLSNGVLGLLAFSIDRIFINRVLGATDVGHYQAHFLATFGIISTLTTIFLTYVFPLFCQTDNTSLRPLLNHVARLAYPIIFVLSLLVGLLVMALYQYPLVLELLVTLSLFCTVQFHVQLKNWQMASKGIATTGMLVLSQVIFLLVNVLVLLFLLDKVEILAGGVALLLASMCSIAFLMVVESRMVKAENETVA
jgi:O-antigen/teichoic acid export membrane protein